MPNVIEVVKPQIGESCIRQVQADVRRSSDNKKTVVVINTADVDTYGTIIEPSGCDLTRYNDNPIVLINHDFMLVAGTSSVALRNNQLVAEMPDDAWDLEDAEIAKWFNKVKRGIVKGASIRFNPISVEPVTIDNVEYWRISKWELLEWSFASVNSNPKTLVSERALTQHVESLEGQVRMLTEQIESLKGFKITPEEILQLVAKQRDVATPQTQPPQVAEPAASTLPASAAVEQKQKPTMRIATKAEAEKYLAQFVPAIEQAVRRSLGKE
jgi:phage head maturation protease